MGNYFFFVIKKDPNADIASALGLEGAVGGPGVEYGTGFDVEGDAAPDAVGEYWRHDEGMTEDMIKAFEEFVISNNGSSGQPVLNSIEGSKITIGNTNNGNVDRVN